MAARLRQSSYGKSQVRLTRVTRHADHHDLKEWCIAVRLEGGFDASYIEGDNRAILPTDTMKNTVYILARKHATAAIEGFGVALAHHFMENLSHVTTCCVDLAEHSWQRLVIDGQAQPHTFLGGGSEQRTCTVTVTRQHERIESGIDGLLLLKTTDSAFTGFLRDPYTTLAETEDRIFATRLTASWLYGSSAVDWDAEHAQIRTALLRTFAEHKSLAVQQTLHAMGQAVLTTRPTVQQIALRMPNKHHWLVDLQRFGLDNPNLVYVPTDEPHGVITATLERA